VRSVAPLILCYHSVSSEWTNPTSVSPDVMAQQLALLRARGYVGFTLSELISRGDNGALPDRALAVTFDDGYASTLKAKPILDEVGYPATVFVVADFVESGKPLTWPGIEEWHGSVHAGELASLRPGNLETLVESGWEIGSHTRTHPMLPTLGREQLVDEIGGSRDQLIRWLGRCDTLAYPYGLTSAETVDVVKSSGYSAACSVTPRRGENGRFCLPRIGLYGGDTGLRLRAKLSPQVYAVSRRWARAVRRGSSQ
jgi:peptidoglycan/xylan/chitin deacetylase (PgdA/CDA1 family)